MFSYLGGNRNVTREGDSGTLGIFIVLCMYDTLWPSRDTKLTYSYQQPRHLQ